MTVLGFSTGLDSFSNPTEIGPLYPFVGAEWFFVLLAVVLWLLWHVLQIRLENRDNERAVQTYERIGLDRVMFYGGSADVPSDEEWARREEQRRRVQTPSAGEPSSDLDDPVEKLPPVPPGRNDG
ncbi:MAG TPA: hypothetical protein VFO88_04375 [Gaiellaceae bacterium]|nr:hypothetical protein [Gaiellaceae bacterium]